MKQKFDHWYYAQGRYYRPECIHYPPENSGLRDRAPVQVWRILRGKFKGITFYFTKVSIRKHSIRFETAIYSYLTIRQINHKKFRKIAHHILLDILERLYSDEETIQMGIKPGEEYCEDRNTYFEEPDTNRALHKKSNSVSEE